MIASFNALLIGCVVAAMPLYIRLSSVNLDRVSKSNALLLLIPLFLLFRGANFREFNNLLKLLFAAAVAHLIVFQFEPASFTGIYQSVCIASSLLFLVVYYETNEKSWDNIILNALCVGAIIQSALNIAQLAGVDLYAGALHSLGTYSVVYNSGNNVEASGSLLNPNIFGGYLALCLPAFFRKWWNCFIPFIVISILSVKSIMPIAAMLCAATYYYMNTKKEWVIWFTSFLLFLVSCLLFQDATSGRIDLWSSLLSRMDLWHFLFGKSPSWFESLHLKVGLNPFENEHSEVFTAFNIFGISGVLVIAYIIKLIAKNRFKHRIFATVAFSGFILMLGSFPLHVAPLALIILIATATSLRVKYVSDVDRGSFIN